jgi:hypothetical protein
VEARQFSAPQARQLSGRSPAVLRGEARQFSAAKPGSSQRRSRGSGPAQPPVSIVAS